MLVRARIPVPVSIISTTEPRSPVADRGSVVLIIETDGDTTEGIMGSWTLRPQRITFRGSNPSAVNRAKRMVRRHGNEFHGAGVQDAIRDLERFAWASRNAREGVASVLAALTPPITETAHGLTVVGWKGENGCAYCPEHRPSGGTMLTFGDLLQTGTVRCLTCGTRLG